MTKTAKTPDELSDGVVEQCEYVYIGARLNRKGSKFHAWLRLDENGKPLAKDNEHWYKPRIERYATCNAQVGSIWLVGLTGDNSIRTSGPGLPEFRRMWHDEKKIAEWQALNRAALDQAAIARQAKKAMGSDALASWLDPIRRAYLRASPQEKRAILALVIQEITSPYQKRGHQ